MAIQNSFTFDFLFNYKVFARTDIATNQTRIHVALKICIHGVT